MPSSEPQDTIIHITIQAPPGPPWNTQRRKMANPEHRPREQTCQGLQCTNKTRNNYATRGPLTTNITCHTRGSTKQQRDNKTPHHNTRKHTPKAQKTKTPQTGHHQSHRIQKKLTRAFSREHHIQRMKKPTTHIV